jgi:hypothetical protein
MVRAALRSKRINDRILEELRKMVLAGIPWVQPPMGSPARGYADLIFIVTGLYYPVCDFIHGKDDTEALVAIWSELREDIIDQHIKHQPRSRPWAWWREDREQRRVVAIDKKMLACNEGRIYESEHDYLKRLSLLTPEEKSHA